MDRQNSANPVWVVRRGGTWLLGTILLGLSIGVVVALLIAVVLDSR
jgi:hypothetical protein